MNKPIKSTVSTVTMELTLEDFPVFTEGDWRWKLEAVEITYHEDGFFWGAKARMVRKDGTIGSTWRVVNRVWGTTQEIVKLVDLIAQGHRPKEIGTTGTTWTAGE
jgi:hypothetical protein